MKLISDYLENAREFERLAAAENNMAAKKQLQAQAEAYYHLAVKRAKALKMAPPERPSGGT